MEKMWLGFGVEELSIERQQLADEGAALPGDLETELNALLTDNGKEDDAFHARVRLFMEQSTRLPRKENFPYDEPSDLGEIQLSKPLNTVSIPHKSPLQIKSCWIVFMAPG